MEHCYSTLLHLTHLDLWQSPILSNLNFRYYVYFVDDCTPFTWIYPIKCKYELYNLFCAFRKMVENLFDQKIKSFQSGGGQEFDNYPLTSHFSSCGKLSLKSCPSTPKHNGVAACKHYHIIEVTYTFLFEASLSSQF